MLSCLVFCAAMAVGDTVQQVPYHAIVIDAETKARIRDAKVIVDDNAKEIKTLWDGSFFVTQPFKQIKISKKGYLSRVMNYEERTDTIVLLNNAKHLDEVVVWGKRPTMHMGLDNSIRKIAASGVKPSGMDFIGAIDHLIHAKKYKRRKKAKKVMEAY